MSQTKGISLPVFLILSLLYREFLLMSLTSEFNISILYILLFSVCFSLFFAFLVSLFKNDKLRFSIVLTLDLLVFVFFITEALLYRSFGYFYTPETIFGMTADIAGSFGSSVINTVFQSLLIIFVFLVPSILLVIFRKRIFKLKTYGLKSSAVTLAAAVVLQLVGYSAVYLDKSEPVPAHELYTYGFDFNKAVTSFGLMTSLRLNTEYSVSGVPEENVTFPVDNGKNEIPRENIKEYNISSEDLTKLKIDNENIEYLCSELASEVPTEKNKYTGLFKEKNLIFICAEALSPYAVSEKQTPTLYKLVNSGFVFRNYYQPSFGESTSGGEYSLLLGQVPKRDSGESGLSMKITCNENLSYSMPGLFYSSGYVTRGFHNNSYTYYQRNVTHPKMKMDWYGVGGSVNSLFGTELDISSSLNPGWPHSDKELIDAVLPVIIDTESPSFSYILTCSGHNNYSFEENAMSRKNRQIYEDSGYSEKIKAYLSCQYELESALTELISGLESSGKLDNTVIALSNDHYPYGLSASWQGNGGKSYIDELYGKTPKNTIELEKGCFFIWSSDMKTPVITEKPVSSFDVLPTVLNLFGIDYDSRFLAGRDALSQDDGFVFFSDRSFITSKAVYDAKTGTFEANVPVDDGYLKEFNQKVKKRINVSKLIRQKKFFGYLKNN